MIKYLLFLASHTHTSGEAYPNGKGSDVGIVLDKLLSEAHD